jgi:hypothetical protein
MATTPTVRAISKEALHTSKEYLALTDKQKVWVNTFIETSDPKRATVEAYGGDTSPEYRAMLCRKIQTSPRILDVLDVWFGVSSRDKFLRTLEADIKTLQGVAKIQALKLYARAAGILDDSDDVESAAIEPEHKFSVGDICVQSGLKFRVTSIDLDGKPLTAEEVIL